MFSRFLIAATAIVLLGCGRQGTAPRSSATDSPAAVEPVSFDTTGKGVSPVVSAVPVDDSAPQGATLASSHLVVKPAAVVIPAGTRIRVRLGQTLH